MAELTDAAQVCFAVTITLGLIAIAAVALRFYCRLKLQKTALGADDWVTLAALILSTALAIVACQVAVQTGAGELAYQPTMEQVIYALQVNIYWQSFHIVCMGLLKVGMFLYYKRIFVNRTFRMTSNILIGVVCAFEFIILMHVLFAKGLPVSRNWDPFAPFKYNISDIVVAYCAGNAGLDLVTLIAPLSVVRSLQMSRQKKIALSTIFSLGSFCVVASLVRLGYAVQFRIAPAPGAPFYTASFVKNILWALIETPLFILADCLLTMGPLFRGKHGPLALGRSLISRLQRGTTGSRPSKSTGQGSGVSASSGGRKFWPLSEDQIARSEDDRKPLANWELSELGRGSPAH